MAAAAEEAGGNQGGPVLRMEKLDTDLPLPPEALETTRTTMSYQAGSNRISASYFIYLPKGVPHAFRVTGPSPVRFLGLAGRRD